MNKLIFLFSCLFIVASCAEMKYKHAVKRTLISYHTSNTSEKATELDSKVSAKQFNVSETPIALLASDETEIQPTAIEERKNAETQRQPADIEAIPTHPVLAVKTSAFENEEDSTKSVSPEKIRQALESENLGIKSRNLGIAGLIFQFTFIFGFVGLILSIIGLIKGIKSLRADYNTPKGVTNAKIGVIFSSITLGLYALTLLLIVILILAFFL